MFASFAFLTARKKVVTNEIKHGINLEDYAKLDFEIQHLKKTLGTFSILL